MWVLLSVLGDDAGQLMMWYLERGARASGPSPGAVHKPALAALGLTTHVPVLTSGEESSEG